MCRIQERFFWPVLGVLLRNERKNLEGGLPAFNEYLSCWEGGGFKP